METKNKKKIVTHDGSFHTDDVFSAAALTIMLETRREDFEIIRTRDEEIIKSAEYVFDVGGVYDQDKNRFDHHQIGGAGRRAATPSGAEIEYASFGLVWKKFGKEICGSEKAAESIDKKLGAPIDAWDNGQDLLTALYKEVSPYFLQNIFSSMEPTWREVDAEAVTGDAQDAIRPDPAESGKMFGRAVDIAKFILLREIIQANDAIEAEGIVLDTYNNSKDKRIIILEKHYPSQSTLQNFPEPLFVVFPRKMNNWWGVKALRVDPKTFKNRKDLPEAWAGKRDEELQKITGVSDAVFCHRARFMAVAQTKEGAIALAQKALGE